MGTRKITQSGVAFCEKFIEELSFENDLGSRPDLIISAHTFEHIENPREQLERLLALVDKGTLIIIEVPGIYFSCLSSDLS